MTLLQFLLALSKNTLFPDKFFAQTFDRCIVVDMSQAGCKKVQKNCLKTFILFYLITVATILPTSRCQFSLCEGSVIPGENPRLSADY